jgi:hypothetical protein
MVAIKINKKRRSGNVSFFPYKTHQKPYIFLENHGEEQ